MTTIGERLGEVLARIEAAARAAGRDPSAVSLLAVSKTWPAAAVREAAAAGQRAFGENYVQEGVDKVEALRDLGLEWHFIGPLQSNKTRPVANAFDWVHGIDRLKIAERLSAQRDVHLPPLLLSSPLTLTWMQTLSGGRCTSRCADRRSAIFRRSTVCTQSKCSATGRVLLLCSGPMQCHSRARSRNCAILSMPSCT